MSPTRIADARTRDRAPQSRPWTRVQLTFALVPLWGIVSDRVGRKPLQLFAFAGYFLSCGLAAMFGLVPLLIVGRVLDGVTACMLPICQASVRDISSPAFLARNVGVLQGATAGASLLVGGLVGLVLTSIEEPRANLAVASIFAACAGLVIFFCAPETLHYARRAPRVAWRRASPVSSVRRLGATPTTFGPSCAYVFFWLGLNALQVSMSNYCALRYQWKPQIALVLQACAVLVIALSNVLGPWLLEPRVGENNVVRIGLVGFAASLVGMGLSSCSAGFVSSVLVSSVATMCLPSLTAMIAREAHKDETGATLCALDQMLVLDQLLAYKAMNSIFAWGIVTGRVGAHFYTGAICVGLGWVAFEAALLHARGHASTPGPMKTATYATACRRRRRRRPCRDSRCV